MKRLLTGNSLVAIFAIIIAAQLVSHARAQGVISPYAGPVNASMGGASTAAPLDALGANYWNPAAISGMSQSEIAIGTQLAYPEIYANSQFRGQGGTTRSDSGLVMIPGLALVYRADECSRLTFGAATYATGAGVNFRGDPFNPIFSPTGPFGNTVLGPSYSNLTILQIVTNVSFQVTDKLAIGAGPVVDYCMVGFDPAFFAPADDANGDGISTFPSATHVRPFWGGGFKAGAYYHVTPNLDMGFGYTSPQWLETWIFNARDELGNARRLLLNARLPAIYSWGIAYKGIEKLTLATDLRFIDYKNATLFGTPVVNTGLGWQNVFAVAVGGQYALTDNLSARVGYVYNTNPIPAVATLFNVQAPAITQHTIGAGLSMTVAENITANLSYSYAFQNSLTGPVREVTATGVTIQTSVHSLLFGVQIKLGCPKNADAPCVPMGADAAPAVMSDPRPIQNPYPSNYSSVN